MFKLFVFLTASLLCIHANADSNSVEINKASESLTANWWQWAIATEGRNSPVRDITGEDCATGQQGNIWFLAGGFGSSKIKRTCDVQSGKKIFFPIINMIDFPARVHPQLSCERAKISAKLNNETALDLFVELDGVAIKDLDRFRISTTTCFDIFASIPISQRPAHGYPSASDGFWILLKPLSKGKHILKFGGRYNRNSAEFGRMVQDIEYELNIH